MTADSADEIHTERLRLRRFTLDDAEDFLRLNSQPEVVRYVGGQPLKSLDEAREMLRLAPLHDYATRGYGRMAVIDKTSQRLIGFCGLKQVAEIDEIDLGYRLLPEFWGKGLITEAARAVLAHGEHVLHLSSIVGVVDPENIASVRVLRKLGFVYERKAHLTFTARELDLYRLPAPG